MPTTVSQLNAALARIAAALDARRATIVADGLQVMRAEMPEFFVRDGDPDFVETYSLSYHQQLRFITDGLAADRSLDAATPPALALDEARMAAARGIPLTTLQHGYRVSHRVLFGEVLALGGHDGEVLSEVSRWLFAYFDWIVAHVVDAYASERSRLVRDRDQRRRHLVEQLLDGRPVDPAPLAYDLAGDHVGVVAWGSHAVEALDALVRAAGGRGLHVPGTERTRWAWVAADVEIAPAPGAQLAVGRPGRGVDGFRRTHRNAWSAYRIARETTAPITRQRDIALLALTLADRDAARDFVHCELGPLGGDGDRPRVLRETLAAYFAAGDNGAAAAHALGVHERTVLYRLRRIEDELGHPIRARRDELAVALRLAPVVLR